MAPAYEVRPIPIGRPARRSPAFAVAAAALVVGLALVKPWDWSGAQEAAARAVMTDASPVASPVPTVPAATAPATIGSLATHSGTWGIGIAGLGQRDGDPPWVDWTAVVPEPAGDTPGRIAMGPGTGICAGVPALPAGALFVAVTSPADMPLDRRLVAWWSDGGRTASLAGSIRQVTAVGDRGVSYLVRHDRAPWTAGRYEFHVDADDRRHALTVCLAATD